MNTVKIKQKIHDEGISLYKLSADSGVAYSTLHDIVNGKAKSPRIDTLTKIANALGVKIENLIWREHNNDTNST